MFSLDQRVSSHHNSTNESDLQSGTEFVNLPREIPMQLYFAHFNNLAHQAVEELLSYFRTNCLNSMEYVLLLNFSPLFAEPLDKIKYYHFQCKIIQHDLIYAFLPNYVLPFRITEVCVGERVRGKDRSNDQN